MTEKEFNRFKLHNRLLDIIPMVANTVLIILMVIAGIAIWQQIKLENKVIQEFEKCVYIGSDLYCKVEK